jgi:anthranilate/para-aminobenzoate synthase component I
MLVDLARNDVNRVCDPLTTRVDKLMVVQKVRAWQRAMRCYRHLIWARC